jgi:Ni,Fe-hydrogenase I small subunit
MRSVIKMVLFVMVALTLTLAYAAGGSQTGTIISSSTIDQINGSNGQYILQLSGAYSNMPACNTLGGWNIRADSPGGKALIAQAIAAQIAGRTLSIVGTGACTYTSTREDVLYMTMN